MQADFRDRGGPGVPAGARLRATAQAQPNIALVKYWGKRDISLNLPVVGSLSITLDTLWTRTRVEFHEDLPADRFTLNGATGDAEADRAAMCLDLLRAHAGVRCRAAVESRNNFPTAAGLASSASGFAALVTAAAAALRVELSDTDKSILARRCSGSAARSIFGGFVEWDRGERADGADSIARPLLGAGEWPLRVAVAITSTQAKEVGSTAGMRRTAETSPYQQAWIESQEADLALARSAIAERDFEALARVAEHSCLKMHALALAAQPGLIYWNGASVECMRRIRALRARGCPVFFTIDAGPQVKAVRAPQALEQVLGELREVPGVMAVHAAALGEGARLIDDADFSS
jgi:diphosphomevalonate decarboxylase